MTKVVLLNNQVCNIMSAEQFAKADPILVSGSFKAVVDIEDDVLVNLHDYYDPNTKTFSRYNINRYVKLRKDLIDQLTSIAINSPIDYNGRSWDADEIAQERLVKTLAVAGVNGNKLPAEFKWRDRNNVNVSVTFEDLAGLSDAILTRNFQAYQVAWEMKDDTTFAPSSEDDWMVEIVKLRTLVSEN